VPHVTVAKKPEVVIQVRIGSRKYGPMGWTRKDEMYVGDLLIGIAKKSQDNVRGITICVTNSTKTSGWEPSWCLTQHLATMQEREEHNLATL
jgi:hypothetical protein